MATKDANHDALQIVMLSILDQAKTLPASEQGSIGLLVAGMSAVSIGLIKQEENNSQFNLFKFTATSMPPPTVDREELSLVSLDQITYSNNTPGSIDHTWATTSTFEDSVTLGYVSGVTVGVSAEFSINFLVGSASVSVSTEFNYEESRTIQKTHTLQHDSHTAVSLPSCYKVTLTSVIEKVSFSGTYAATFSVEYGPELSAAMVNANLGVAIMANAFPNIDLDKITQSGTVSGTVGHNFMVDTGKFVPIPPAARES